VAAPKDALHFGQNRERQHEIERSIEKAVQDLTAWTTTAQDALTRTLVSNTAVGILVATLPTPGLA